ncbi:porin [Pedobacter agri]|uniref:porin n=1 Tax=Pedobacter agri TaxID=454586 RepID=UPI00292DB7EA|nr:porin [Pedobacter agri]
MICSIKIRSYSILRISLIALFFLPSSVLWAQSNPVPVSSDSVAKPLLHILKKIQLSGTIRSRYTAALNHNVGIDGVEHSPGSASFSNNAFNIPQARLVVSGDVTSKMEVYFRANFADFSRNPQGRVLEYAYATYHFNHYLNVRMGVFRPYFGREDDIATDFLKSFDYSNQYTAFDENGWMNYQMGVSLSGELKCLAFPIRYYVGVYNGNRRNDFTDNDNGKQFPARVELDFTPDFQLGLNGGVGKENGEKISVWGVDVYYKHRIGTRWELDMVTEYKQGNNQSLFFSEAIPGVGVNEYQVRGAYILPSVLYKINSKEVKGLEASFKYEYLNPNYEQNGNTHNQFVPMLGIDFAEQNALRLQVGMLVDRYDHNIENSLFYNSSRFITQLQIRF